MYTLEKKQLAVETYFKLKSTRKTIRCLGYPGARITLLKWIKEYNSYGKVIAPQRKKPKPRYTDKEIDFAVRYWAEHGENITFTCNTLGYPCRTVLSRWLDERFPDRHNKSVLKGVPLKKYSYNDKVVASINLTCREGTALELSQESQISCTSLYKWKRQLIPQGERFTMANNSTNEKDLIAQIDTLKQQAADLQQQVHRLQLEKDALEKASELIKKAKGINLQTLSNYEKAIIIDALRDKYCLKELLNVFVLSKSSYFYQHNAIIRPDKYKAVRDTISTIFYESGDTYGYRRVHAMLKRNSITLSEKVIRRIMKEEKLLIKKVKIRKYCSYMGEISAPAPNVIQRNFKAEAPNQKWLTDITEFHIPSGKVYLSPIIDCFDGLPVAWTIGTSPNAELVNTMLDIAIKSLPAGSHPIVHSDRGAHYRWPGWIERIEKAKLIRSMSKKGCSPDNAACEAFFGRLKNEMFYNHSWINVSLDEFIDKLDNYIRWYSTGRIKMSLGAMSPMEYRRSLGLIS